MDLTSLLLFSVSVFLLGLYQTVPTTDIGPTTSWFGPGFNNIVEAVFAVTHTVDEPGPASTNSPSFANFDSPTTLSPPTLRPTCTVQPLTLASTPIATQDKPAPIFADPIFPHGDYIRAPEYIPHNAGSWIEEVFETILDFSSSILPSARDFALAVCFALCIAALAGVVGATLTITYATYTVVKRSAAEFAQKVQAVNADVDQLAAEAQRHRDLVVKKMDGITAAIAAAETATSERLGKLRERLDEAAVRAQRTSDSLHQAVTDIQQQYLPFPTRDELLKKDLKEYRAELDAAAKQLVGEMKTHRAELNAAAEDLASEMTAVKTMIPDFRKEFDGAVTTLRKEELEGTLRQKLAGEKKKIRRAVQTLREAREESLDLSALTGEAEKAREEARNLQETLKEAVKESQTALGGVPQLQECLGQAQTAILQLKEDIAVSRLARDSLAETAKEPPKSCAPMVSLGENEDLLGDGALHPEPDQVDVEALVDTLPDLDPELMDELLGMLPDDDGIAEPGVPSAAEQAEEEAEDEQGEGSVTDKPASIASDDTQAPADLPRLVARGRQSIRQEEMSPEESLWLASRRNYN